MGWGALAMSWFVLKALTLKRKFLFGLSSSARTSSCVFFLLIKVFKATEACFCSHTLQTVGSCSSTSTARLISSLKVLCFSSEMSRGGTSWATGPWDVRPGEVRAPSRCVGGRLHSL